ncbi:hypothetical protein [Comamonas granuli]|uniref:hypothetical protein n=1 Tax=Comamonas granuli TaxID=290309 RepID=UPI0005A8DE33|nr:hypothetical protein [Comamonas granuli]
MRLYSRPLTPSRKLLARRLGLAWLLLALVLAPALGQMHRALHLPGALGQAVHAADGHGVAALFGGHSPADCQLLDQLSHGGATVAEYAMPLAAPGGQRVALPAALPLRAAAPLPFQARAPPAA